MHDTKKRVDGAAVFRTGIAISKLERLLSEDTMDSPLIWVGKTESNQPIRVCARLGILSIHLESASGEQEIARVNLGWLEEVESLANRKIQRLRRNLPNLRVLNQHEENRCWQEASRDPEAQLFASHKVMPSAFGGIWQTIRTLNCLFEARDRN